MAITLEAGKRYRTRDGRVTGPMRKNLSLSNDVYPWRADVLDRGMVWTNDGHFHGDKDEDEDDLIALYEEPGTPAPTRTDESIRHEEVMAVLRRIADALAPPVTDKPEQAKAREWWEVRDRDGDITSLAQHPAIDLARVAAAELDREGLYSPYTIVHVQEVLP